VSIRAIANLSPAAALTLLVCATGCHSQSKGKPATGASASEVPRNAQLIGQAVGGIGLHAPRDGTMFIVDADLDQIVYQADLKSGDMSGIDGASKRIVVNGRVVKSEPKLDAKHHYKVYFLSGP
jgi:hypothetical protein